MASQPKWAAPALPRWFPTPAQEERASAAAVIEAPQRPFSTDEDRALRGTIGKHGMVKVLAIALGRGQAELYRRRARLQQLDRARGK
jgi:hypothetical protein